MACSREPPIRGPRSRRAMTKEIDLDFGDIAPSSSAQQVYDDDPLRAAARVSIFELC